MSKESPRSPRPISAPTLSVMSDLTPKERSSVLSAFPEYEDEVQFTFRGKCKYQNQLQENGMVAVSAHYVGVFGQRSSGYAFTKTGFFHILTMKTLEVRDNKSLFIETTSGRSLFVEGDTLELSRIIYRNYSFATLLIPQTLKVKIASKRDLPELKVPLSVSQMFQFTFAALCTQFEQKYDHAIVQYVHSLVTSSSAVVEMNRIPTPYHAPMLMSLVNLPGVLGISASDIDCPNVMKEIVGFVEKARGLRYLRVDNCNCVNGLAELGKAIEENARSLQLETLIVANNEFKDVGVFLESIKHLKSTLKTFSVSCIGFREDETDVFMDILTSNSAFRSLNRLGSGGISFSNGQLQALAKYLKENKHIRRLDLSGSSNFAGVLKAMKGTTVTELWVTRCDFDDTCVAQLLEVAPNLTFCDLSGSNLKCNEICDILSLLGRNQLSSPVSVKMNELDFSGVNILPIIRGFLLSDLGKWKSIEMCDTQIKSTELETLQALFLRMPRLSELSLDSNFGEEDVDAVRLLLELPELRYLSLASSKLSALCPHLAKVKRLKYLNLADNGLNDEAVATVLSNDYEVLCLADNNVHNAIPVEDLAHSRPSLKFDPLLKDSMTAVNDHVDLDQAAAKILEGQIRFSHSCICEDLGFPLPCMCSFDVSTVAVGDADAYQLTHLNAVAVEVNREIGDLNKTVRLAPVMVSTRLGARTSEVDDQAFTSDSSIDRLMNTNLIPTLSDTMFAGLGGEISETSSDNDHRTDDTLSMDPAVQELMNSRVLTSGDLPALEPIDDGSESDEGPVEIVRTGTQHGRHQPAPQLEATESSDEDDGFDWGETKRKPRVQSPKPANVHKPMPIQRPVTESDIESEIETGSEEEQSEPEGFPPAEQPRKLESDFESTSEQRSDFNPALEEEYDSEPALEEESDLEPPLEEESEVDNAPEERDYSGQAFEEESGFENAPEEEDSVDESGYRFEQKETGGHTIEEEDSASDSVEKSKPHVRLFGPIGEESQSSSRSGSPKKRIPPPSSSNSTTKFWKISASLLPNLRSKPTDSKHNPLLLAFSPPTLAKKPHPS